MTSPRRFILLLSLGFIFCALLATPLYAEYDETDEGYTRQAEPSPKNLKPKKKYFVADPQRIDAGNFHVGFAAGGNVYLEPEVSKTNTSVTTGNYYKDFGFQGGAYFDYDYGDIALGLRGFVGYKYVLSSTHVFAFDALARYMFSLSNNAKFGLGLGTSAAMWYRTITSTSNQETFLFLPSFLLGAGFEFNPFMIDFKWVINKIGGDNTLMGFELYFGFRL